MPDLNLGSDAVRSEIRDIMAYWLDLGVSGFRVDAAKEFYSGKTDANIEVLSWLQQTGHDDCYRIPEPEISKLYVGKLLDAGEQVEGVERVISTSCYLR